MQETSVRFLSWEDPLEKSTHSSILAWRIPWTEEPGGLQSMGSRRVGHDCVAFTRSLRPQAGGWLQRMPAGRRMLHPFPTSTGCRASSPGLGLSDTRQDYTEWQSGGDDSVRGGFGNLCGAARHTSTSFHRKATGSVLPPISSSRHHCYFFTYLKLCPSLEFLELKKKKT